MNVDNFKGKKILIMGLGILGRGVNAAKFFAETGARLTITDLKTKQQLASSIAKLKKFKNITYILGKHRLADFRNKDMILKSAGVPLDSPYIVEARKNKIPIEMDASLFAKLSKATIIGITGTRGKSTITHLIYEIIKNSGRRVFLGGNVKGIATLPLLGKVREGDTVVLELDSWQLQGFGDSKISPHIAVFTNFMRDHMNYYRNDTKKYFKDKSNIFKYQTEHDFLIVGENFAKNIRQFGLFKNFSEFKKSVKSKIIVAKQIKVWKTKLVGQHNKRNIAAAVVACECLGVKENIIKRAVENFKSVSGRLEFIREIKRVKYYNDTTATTPDGVIAGLRALNKYKGKIILIGGGSDKMLEYGAYVKLVKQFVKALILFKGAASDKIISVIGKTKFSVTVIGSMKDAMIEVQNLVKKGDIVLLSPGAASFGIFKNEFDRGDQFCKIVKKL